MRFLSPLSRLLILTLGIVVFLLPHAYAQDEQHVSLRLVPEFTHIQGKDEIWIGIEQIIDPHWHTYWKNPGDSGSAPSLKWDLPEGFDISEIHWPLPEKIAYGPLTNYGYSERTVLLQKLSLPDTAADGPVTLNAEYEILVCQEECIPEFGALSLTLNTGEPADNTGFFDPILRSVPAPIEWPAHFSEEGGAFVLTITPDDTAAFEGIDPENIAFLPLDWGLVNNSAQPEAQWENGRLSVRQPRGDRPIQTLDEIHGVITYKSPAGGPQAFEITAHPAGFLAAPGAIIDAEKTTSIWGALLFALLGGLILNLMPCVFPVLSIKALSLLKISEKHPALARLHGLSYTAGVMLSFIGIAGLLIALQAAGAQIGWGFQLQNPWVVGALALLLLAISLNFAGVFEIRSAFGNVGTKLASGQNLSGSFFTGVLATLVATPCTAPFMAGAIAYALLQPPVISLLIFAMLGLGLALPYLVLSFAPRLQKALPKPGPWMVTFRKILAIPMFLAALWLFWVLSQQIGPAAHQPGHMPAFGETYSAEILSEALSSDQPVFVEMTAAWCITCKVNHKIALNIDSTKALFEEKNVKYLVGDWTNQDPEITQYLKQYGRSGVPIYVYYGPPDAKNNRPDPVVLPQVLTPQTVQEYISGTKN